MDSTIFGPQALASVDAPFLLLDWSMAIPHDGAANATLLAGGLLSSDVEFGQGNGNSSDASDSNSDEDSASGSGSGEGGGGGEAGGGRGWLRIVARAITLIAEGQELPVELEVRFETLWSIYSLRHKNADLEQLRCKHCIMLLP